MYIFRTIPLGGPENSFNWRNDKQKVGITLIQRGMMEKLVTYVMGVVSLRCHKEEIL